MGTGNWPVLLPLRDVTESIIQLPRAAGAHASKVGGGTGAMLFFLDSRSARNAIYLIAGLHLSSPCDFGQRCYFRIWKLVGR